MKKLTILCYPKCGTCRKAVKWLEANGLEAGYRDITVENPAEEEIRAWASGSGLPLKKFFNTSGLLYKEMKLKERVGTASDEELVALLASDGKLVKRPVLLYDGGVLVGFDEAAWRSALNL